uniref:Uncharacterized protein n=1 Tax=Plectus sambesii TaxID=2011161 RepID=A0A914UVU8_9BILA
MRKLKDVNLHLRKMEELSTEETKTMDAEWKEFQIIHGILKSESQVKYTSPNIIMFDESEKSRGFGEDAVGTPDFEYGGYTIKEYEQIVAYKKECMMLSFEEVEESMRKGIIE